VAIQPDAQLSGAALNVIFLPSSVLVTKGEMLYASLDESEFSSVAVNTCDPDWATGAI